MNRRIALSALAGAVGMGLGPLLPRSAIADSSYPNRSIRMLAGFAPGGGTDLLARYYAQKLTTRLGVPVVVENRTGAGGNIAMQSMVTMPADGYAITFAGSYVAVNAAFKRNPYDWRTDIKPVAFAGWSPNLVTVGPASGIDSIAGLIKVGRTREKPLTFGSPGVGSASHMAGELFASMTGIRMTHIPYRGTALSEMDLAAGTIDVLFGNLTTGAKLAETGKIKALAVTGPRRAPTVPDLPTVSESGVPGYESTTNFVMMVHGQTPDAILKRINAAVNDIIVEADTRDYLQTMHTVAEVGDVQTAARVIADEVRKWETLLKTVNIDLG